MNLTNINISDKLAKQLEDRGVSTSQFVEELIEEKIERKLRRIECAEENYKVIKSKACKKCRGIKVRSWITGMMSASWGKRCTCKSVE